MQCTINGKKDYFTFSGQVKELLQKLGINEQIVIVKVNGKIVTELDKVNDSDIVEIQKVILGG
ncbi:MAG: MoaD/ThiS family protein [Candidatus Micrarchaeota archaeon]|nr:MoaD/ThiS family protein [Candidatus Micrarchaeota archaeon]